MSEETLRAIQEATHDLDPSTIIGLVVRHRGREIQLSWAVEGDRWRSYCEIDVAFYGAETASGSGDTPLAALDACADDADRRDDDEGDPRPPMHEIMHSASEMGGYDQDDEHPPVERLDLSKPPPGYEVRNTSYEDGDDEVGGYGVMIEEWSWLADGYTDSAASRETCVADAWLHFKKNNDPPGMTVVERDDGKWWRWGALPFGAVAQEGQADSEDEARAAAWAWYERRSDIVERLDAMARDSKYLAAVGVFEPGELWPDALSWADDYVQTIEDVLRARDEPGVLRG